VNGPKLAVLNNIPILTLKRGKSNEFYFSGFRDNRIRKQRPLCVASARTGLQLKSAQYAGTDGVRMKPGDFPVCENLLKEIWCSPWLS
jgi:hypothetical protein